MRKIIIGAAVMGLSVFGAVAPAQAGPTDPRSNTGYCISDGFYGNQPNLDADGNVVPSQSPGPKKTLPDGSVVPGNRIGDYNSGRVLGTPFNIPQYCRSLVG